jgi:hypothetical protein
MSEPAPVPRRGQIWEAAAACEVRIQYLFNAPITFSGVGNLAAGERIRVMTEEDAGSPPLAVSFLPVRYDQLHDDLVPRDIRETPRYQKYILSLEAGQFHEHFRFIASPAD